MTFKAFMRKASLVLTAFILAALCIVSALPVKAEDTEAEYYVYDNAELLTSEEDRSLERYAKSISEQYNCGVYIVTAKAMAGDDINEEADTVYHEIYGLGVGDDKDGIMLLLCMAGRDYALLTNGEWAETAFSTYATRQLEKTFLDDFADDQWYDGFYDYLYTCSEYLALAESGQPVSAPKERAFLIILGISAVVAGIITLILNSKMKSVHTAVQAAAYKAGTLNLTDRRDLYTHTTTTTRIIEKSSSSGSSSVSTTSHGSTVRSGKF